MWSTHKYDTSCGVGDGREVGHALGTGLIGVEKSCFDDQAAKAMNDEDERSTCLLPVADVRQICAQICGMLLDCVVRNDSEGTFIHNISVVAPGSYPSIRDAVLSVRKKILRPEACISLSLVSSPCCVTVAR